MNVGTHFDYNNHIAFLSTHTKIGTPHAKAPVTVQTEVNFADSVFSNVAASFRQCLPPIVSKLSTRDKSQNLDKATWFQALYVDGRGLAMIDRLLTVSLVVEKS